MRLKNKFFINSLKGKLNIFKSKFFVLHVDQNEFFFFFRKFCIEKKFFLYKVKNSLFKRFFGRKNPVSSLLKSSTFLLFLENFDDLRIFLDFYQKNILLKNNVFILGFYESFYLYNFSKIISLCQVFNSFSSRFLLTQNLNFFFCLFALIQFFFYRVIFQETFFLIKFLKIFYINLNANNKSVIKGY